MSRKILQYSSIGNTIDGTNYCSGVETFAENLMEDNEDDAVVVFPSKDGWASLRSTAYRMTTENTEAILPVPIYKINSIQIKVPNIAFHIDMETEMTVYLKDFKDNNGNYLDEFDVTKYVVNENIWNTLLIASKGGTYPGYCDGIYKDNTFYWKENSNSIPFLSTVYTKGSTILGGIFADKTPTYIRLFKTLLYVYGDSYTHSSGFLLSTMANKYTGFDIDVRDWLFRIEYVPMTSKTKIRARKNAPTAVDYIQPYNQRAEINAVSALGKNMYLMAQKTGVREIEIVKNYTKLADIPPLGALVRHNGKRYRLVANTYKQTNTIFVQVTHTLSENWTSRSKHIAVDQKYRNWKIPQDTLWRNLYWEDYVLISPKLNVGVMYQKEEAKASMALSYIMQALTVDTSADETVDTMYFIKGAYDGMLQGVYTPCSTMSIGNSIVFTGAMQDNFSGGLRRNSNDINLCEEALYCNEDGTLENMCVILSAGVKGGIFNAGNGVTADATAVSADGTTHADSLYAANMVLYPTVGSLCLYDGAETPYLYTINAPAKVLMHNDFHVDKDPGEALKFTYQIHFVSDGGIIVGSKLAEHNPLIKQWKTNRKFRLWGVKETLGEGADIFVPRDDEPCWRKLSDNEGELSNTFTVTDRTQGLDGKEVFVLSIDNLLTGCIGWCITDENNNIYLACNDKKIKTVYFQMTHKRVQK